MKPLLPAACLALVILTAAAGAEAPSTLPADYHVVTTEPMEIKGEAINSYPIGLQLVVNKETKRVRKIFITSVQPGSDAAKQGLQAGDEIVKIDGQPVEGMDPTIGKDSPLGSIFLKRPPGTPLWLDVVVHQTKQVLLHAAAM